MKEITAVVILLAVAGFLGSYSDFVQTGKLIAANDMTLLSSVSWAGVPWALFSSEGISAGDMLIQVTPDPVVIQASENTHSVSYDKATLTYSYQRPVGSPPVSTETVTEDVDIYLTEPVRKNENVVTIGLETASISSINLRDLIIILRVDKNKIDPRVDGAYSGRLAGNANSFSSKRDNTFNPDNGRITIWLRNTEAIGLSGRFWEADFDVSNLNGETALEIIYIFARDFNSNEIPSGITKSFSSNNVGVFRGSQNVNFRVTAKGDYVKKDWYMWRNNAWQMMGFSVDTTAGGVQDEKYERGWIKGAASSDVSMQMSSGTYYIAAGTCQYVNSQWKCGCRTAMDCNKWQVQSFVVGSAGSGDLTEEQIQSLSRVLNAPSEERPELIQEVATVVLQRIVEFVEEEPAETDEIACEGNRPLGDGVMYGNTFRSADYTPVSWTPSESGGPCTWKCASGYQRSGETCARTAGAPERNTVRVPRIIPNVVDYDADGIVDFDDFFMFVDAFGKRTGESGFHTKFDLDKSGAVDYTDFFAFADNFGKRRVVRTLPTARSCSGSTPSGTNLIKGSSWYSAGETSAWTYDESASTSTACKWKCASGYTRNVNNLNTCVASSSVVYVCTGTPPQNAQLCSGDGSGLSVNTPITLVGSDSCSSSKCEYICVSGYVRSGSSCIASINGGTASVSIDVGTVSEYSTMSGMVTASGLGLVTGGDVTTTSGVSRTYRTYIDLTSPQSVDYELAYDNMRAQLSSRQLNFGPLPAVATRNSYFYKTAVEFPAPIVPSDMPGMVMNLFGTDYTVFAASSSGISLLTDAQTVSNIKQGEVREFTFGGQKYSVQASTIRESSVDSVRIRKEVASGTMDTLTPLSGSSTKDMAQSSFEKFGDTGSIYVGLKRIGYTSLHNAANEYDVIVGSDIVEIAENSETSNPGYFIDVETDSSGRITKLVVYVTKSNEGNNYLKGGETFTDPFWKSFRIKMGVLSETQAVISVEKVA